MSLTRNRAASGVLALLIACTTPGFAAALATAPAPPPTPVPPHGSLSPFPSALQTPADPFAAPAISAPVAALADLRTGRLLFSKGADVRRPIASITKVMTALLVLERGHLDETVTVPEAAVFARKDYGASSTIGLHAGERISVRDLLYGLLLGSANDAAVALAIHEAGTVEGFVGAMNERAARLGMTDTIFFSPNGLDDRGHSTAADLVTLTQVASRTPGFVAIVGTRSHTIHDADHSVRVIQNRNVMLWLYPGATGTKTGFTAAAGYCLDATAERNGRTLIAIVLGAPDDAFSDAAALLNYGFEAFSRHTFVRLGDEVGDVTVRGGTIPALAGGTISGLVPMRSVEGARRRVSVDPAASFPAAPGQQIGTLRITVPGLTVGTVPLLAGELAAPTPQDSRAWWARAAGTVGHAVVQAVGALVP